jgi:hypothetical protein
VEDSVHEASQTSLAVLWLCGYHELRFMHLISEYIPSDMLNIC